VDNGEISMVHASILSAVKVKDLNNWIERVRRNGITSKKIKRELRKAGEQKPVGRRKRYMKNEMGGIRMYPFVI